MATPSFNLAPGETSTDAQLRRKMALQMLQEGMSAEPVRHPLQGAARVAQALMGGLELRAEDARDQKEKDDGRQAMISFLGGGAGGATGAPAAPGVVDSAPLSPTAPASAAAPMGKLPALGSRVYSQDEFNPMDAAVATPKELAAGVNAPPQYASLIGKAAVDNDLPPNLLAAQLKRESGFNPNAVSSAGATGISQFMPGTAKEMGVSDPRDPTQAIPAGARYLRQNIDKFDGSVPLGLAAYNAGPGRVERAGGDISKLPAETQGYVAALTPAASMPVVNPTAPTAAMPPVAAGGATAPPPNAAAQSGVSPEQREKLVAMLQNKYTAPMAQAIISQMVTNQMAPKDSEYKVVGNSLVEVNPRKGLTPRPVFTDQKVTFGDTGQVDSNGRPVKGFIDAEGKKVEAYTPPATPNAQPSVIQPPPPGADPVAWNKAQNERIAAQGMPASFDDTAKVRHEIRQLPSYKNMAEAAPIYKTMLDAANRDSKASDLNLVYGLGKIFDPGSVVREGEMVMVKNTAGLPEWFVGTVNALNGGAALTPETRQAIMNEARSRISSYKSLFDQDAGMYSGIAERNRMKREDVIPDFGEFPEWKKAVKPEAGGPVEIDGYKIRAK